jgi:putative spermidine/putrescine transport system ATP-binding protein
MSSGNSAIKLSKLTKRFGDFVAVDNLDLEIAEGEFFSMLGPSGSGKTTVLRMIAGFELPTSGNVQLGDEDVTDKAPFDRDVNTVFQDYALFPHMSVLENVAYGLRVRGVGKKEREAEALAALETVQLAHLGSRKPSELSGGQRQRVALARAIVVKPKVLLLDEPLGALDLKLREQMQIELKALQRELGITFIFVTHDQEEALTLSDRVAVFNNGRIEQLGTPEELYDKPSSEFVARFVGTSNIFTADEASSTLGLTAKVSIRPEKLRVTAANGSAPNELRSPKAIDCVVEESVYLGVAVRIHTKTSSGQRISVLEHDAQQRWHRGDSVKVWFEEQDLVRID